MPPPPLCEGNVLQGCSLTLLTAAPAVVLLLILAFSELPLGIGKTWIGRQFTLFLELREAEVLLGTAPVDKEPATKSYTHSFSTVTLLVLSVIQLISWTGVTVLEGLRASPAVWPAAALMILWAHSTVIFALRPRPTPHYKLVFIHAAYMCGAVVRLGSPFYAHNSNPDIPLPNGRVAWALALDTFVALLVVVTHLSRPIAIPGEHVDVSQIGVTRAPEDYVTVWSWLTFSWVYPIIQKGASGAPMKNEDVWEMSPIVSTKAVFLKFMSLKRSSLFRQIWAAHSRDMLIHFTFVYASVALNYSQPMFLKGLLDAINGDGSDAARSKAVVYAFLMFGASLLKSESDLQYLWLSRRVSGQIRCELMTAIYEKALKRKDLSGAVKEKEEKKEGEEEGSSENEKTGGADIGKIVNLMSSDADRLSNAAIFVFALFGAPVEAITACVLLYQLLGWSAFAGFSTFLVVLPINQLLTKRGIRITEKHTAATDARMSTLTELITEAKFIKFFAWEGKWINRTLDARKKELGWIIQDRINDTFFSLMWMLVPNIVSVTSFLAYIYTGHTLTIPVAFTAISLFQMLQHPLNIIPYFVARFLQWGVSVRRIRNFLEEDEVPDFVSSLKRSAVPPTESAVLGIEKASFMHPGANVKKDQEKKPEPKAWFWKRWFSRKPATPSTPELTIEAEEEVPFELRDIDVTFPDGKLTLVTGPTASGKSSLLRALLGEMTQTSTTGKVNVPKSPETVGPDGLAHAVSYAAQTSWLQHATIKENILYGSPLDEERYDAVIEACALKPDFKVLEDGDSTEVGARGVSLSGGQKARCALARAVYQRTKIVLLDDPLSAVDSHTARRLLDKLFRGPLLENRTVVLVTHHVELMLPAASHIVRMLDGRIDSFGSISELRSQGLLDDIKQEAEIEAAHDAPPAEGEAQEAAKDDAKKPKKLIEEESRAEGGVAWSIYKVYLKASAYITWVAIAILILAYQVFRVGTLLWMRIWGEAGGTATEGSGLHYSTASASMYSLKSYPLAPQRLFSTSTLSSVNETTFTTSNSFRDWPNADEHPLYYVGIYAAIAGAMALTGLAMSIVEYIGAYYASKNLFKRLLVGVVRAPFRWFDTTPTGRILNRFSRDIEVIDTSLSSSFGVVLSEFVTFLAGVVTIAYVIPGFLIPSMVVMYLYYHLAVGYLNTSRSLRRMEANARSPVFESFNELLTGIVSVRAFSSEARFLGKFYELIDSMNRSWWAFWMLNRYLLFRFDVIGAFTVLATALLGLFSMGSDGNFAGWAGITITSAMSLCMSIYWTARFYTQLELDLNSVERLVEYLDIKQEAPAIIESNRPPAYWPSASPEKPLLEVEDLTIKYAPELPAVLHSVNFSLKGHERVGLLGRTGSGKSTIAMSLLRFVDPTEGKIIIDGIDVTKIGLEDLRSNITFIPQDASLFSGTVRDNLDPFNEHTDEECAEALVRVHLVSSAASAFGTKSSAAPSPSTSRPTTPDAETRSVSTVTRVDDERKAVTLSTKVSAGGTNFSHGQRQLISLARALLRRCNIIIMDEATSGIDFDTDAKIQATIREEFKNALLLTIAHRLKTIADYDRLIVLDKGRVVEFDTPANLIRKEGGLFRDMALKSGIFTELEGIAFTAERRSNAESDPAA